MAANPRNSRHFGRCEACVNPSRACKEAKARVSTKARNTGHGICLVETPDRVGLTRRDFQVQRKGSLSVKRILISA